MLKKISRNKKRLLRHKRIRKKIIGTKTLPRLSVFRSHKHIAAQIIDDQLGITLVSASSLDKSLKLTKGGNKEAAKVVGKSLAEKAKAKKIKDVIFDRSGYLYHGRLQALAEAAREAGLKF